MTTPTGVTIVDAGTGASRHADRLCATARAGPRDVIWIGTSTRLGVRHAFDLDVVDIAPATSRARPSHRSGPTTAAMAADAEGRRIAVGDEPAGLIDFATESTVRVLDSATGDLIRSIEVPSGRVIDLSFQPGGDLLAVGTDDAGLYVVDTATGETVFSRSSLVGAVGRFSPDGTKLAVRDQAGTVTVIEPTTGDVLLPAVVHSGELRNVFFAPDADALLVDAVDEHDLGQDGRTRTARHRPVRGARRASPAPSAPTAKWSGPSDQHSSCTQKGLLDESESTAYRPADGNRRADDPRHGSPLWA